MERKKYIIFEIRGGAGKNVLATQVVQAIKAKYPERLLIIVTTHEYVWLHNPDVWRIYDFRNFNYFYEDYVKAQDTIVFRQEVYESPDYIKGKMSLVKCWHRMYGLPITKGYEPMVYITPKELQAATFSINKTAPLLLIQPYGGVNETTATSWYRNMPIELAQNIVNAMSTSYRVVQIKLPEQLALSNCEQFTAENPRDLISMVKIADKIIGIDSFVQHLAAACGKKATVLFPSNRQKTLYSHELHDNIVAIEDYSDFVNKYAVYEPFNIAGVPLEYPFDSDKQMWNDEEIINKLKQN